VFDGRVLNWWTTREMTMRSALSARFLVVKFVRATRLLPWLCRNFQVRAPMLLMRHPCAVVASQVRSDTDWQRPPRPIIPPFLDGLPHLRKTIEGLSTREEFLAAEWAMDYLPCLMTPAPHPWQLVSYEGLVRHSQVTIEKLFARWNEPVPPGVNRNINVPSSMTWKSGISGLEGWRKQLDRGQVRRILDVVHQFGMTFYDENPEPKYDLPRGNEIS
jgi:hypothetical protein